MDRMLAAQPLKVPVMLVGSLWDQEDIYGAIAVYKAIKPKDTGNDKVFLVMGPWHHGQEIGDGSTLGPLHFGSDTGALLPARNSAAVSRPLPEGWRAEGGRAPVTAFETGTNVWRRLPGWPAGCASGCTIRPTPLYLEAGLKLGFAARRRATRHSTSTSPILPSPCRTVRGRFGPWATTQDLVAVAGGRSAGSLGPAGRAGVRFRCSDRADEDQRGAGGESGGLDQRHGFRLGGEAD